MQVADSRDSDQQHSVMLLAALHKGWSRRMPPDSYSVPASPG